MSGASHDKDKISRRPGNHPPSRRQFLAATAAAAACTIVPRHVLGGPGHRAPSDKIALDGLIGLNERPGHD